VRIKSLNDIEGLGDNAKEQIKRAINQQGGIDNKKRLGSIDELSRQEKKAEGPSKKNKKKAAKVMTNDDGYRYCPYPNPDPSVALHIALLAEFGSWWQGGELADEMIIPGHEIRFRYDFCFPRYRLAIEVDGFGYHRDLDSFKKDREKQKHALKLGWVVHRLTNSDLRHAFENIIPDIKTILSHRERHHAEIIPIGKTWCSLVLNPDNT
jgi:hypothetical protein